MVEWGECCVSVRYMYHHGSAAGCLLKNGQPYAPGDMRGQHHFSFAGDPLPQNNTQRWEGWLGRFAQVKNWGGRLCEVLGWV